MSEIPMDIPNNYNPFLDLIQDAVNNQIEEDIDPPTQEELARAIAICDRYKLPEPEVPQPQIIDSPSWD